MTNQLMLRGITHEQLILQFKYNQDTGEFIRRSTGTVPGSLNSSGYIQISIFGKLYQAHRLAWLYVYKEWPIKFIDHIDRNRTNNKISNLRCVSHAENLRNRTRKSTNNSGITGVHFCKRDKVWRAQIQVNKMKLALGNFNSMEKAVEARKAAEERYGFSCE